MSLSVFNLFCHSSIIVKGARQYFTMHNFANNSDWVGTKQIDVGFYVIFLYNSMTNTIKLKYEMYECLSAIPLLF